MVIFLLHLFLCIHVLFIYSVGLALFLATFPYNGLRGAGVTLFLATSPYFKLCGYYGLTLVFDPSH